MSWQTPDGDPPPDSAARPPDAAASEPDAETARFPVAETPQSDPSPPPTSSEPEPPPPPDAPPLTPDAPPPPAGIISAAPVGWTGPADASGNQPADGPVVPWSAPVAAAVAAPVASTAEGVVIARVFPRVVAYCVDVILLTALGFAVSVPLGLDDPASDRTLAFIVGVVLLVVDLVYFIGLWTSRLQATLGMRLLRLRVLDASTAGTLRPNDALLRWIGLAGAIGILGLVPGLESSIGLIGAIWLVVLLVSTGTDRLHQGLHDRWARSVVVQPAPGSSSLAIATCLILVIGFGIVLPLVGLALYGDQLRDLIIEIGNSI
jgi:uncharacterized RDD family membrane protein YckC